jgi:hypothetical protein
VNAGRIEVSNLGGDKKMISGVEGARSLHR